MKMTLKMLKFRFILSVVMSHIDHSPLIGKLWNVKYDIHLVRVFCILSWLVNYWVPANNINLMHLIYYYCNYKSLHFSVIKNTIFLCAIVMQKDSDHIWLLQVWILHALFSMLLCWIKEFVMWTDSLSLETMEVATMTTVGTCCKMC